MLVALLNQLGGGGSLGQAIRSCARLAIARPLHTVDDAAPSGEPPADDADASSQIMLATAPDGVEPLTDTQEDALPAPVPARAEGAQCLWTVLGNPVVYGLSGFTVA